LLDCHVKSGAEGTIYLTEVDEPGKFGVVLTDENSKVKRFIEKPKEFISNKINAGLYIFNTKIIDRIPVIYI
jgi:mannose-1-phosphate guanylyltransferase